MVKIMSKKSDIENKNRIDDKLSADYLIKAYKVNIARKIYAGEVKLASELEYLKNLEKREEAGRDKDDGRGTKEDKRVAGGDGEEIGVPERLRVKRHYTMSPAAVNQRRDRRSKGGKASAKKHPNKNWKHGKYAASSVNAIKRCISTCEKYPCELIEANKVKPGDACLDMVFVLQTFEAINKAVKNKDYEDFNEIASLNISQSMEILRMCQEDIIRDGTIVKSEKIDKDGNVIGFEIKPHPSMLVLPKLIAELGMTPQEIMITERQRAKQGSEEEGMKTIADLIGSVGKLKKTKEE